MAITTLWRVPSSLFFNEQKIPPAKDNVSFGIRSGEVCFLLKKTDAVAIRQRFGWLWHFFHCAYAETATYLLVIEILTQPLDLLTPTSYSPTSYRTFIFDDQRHILMFWPFLCCARAERQFLLPAQSCFLRNFTAKIWRSLKWRFFRDLWHMTQANSAFYP